MKLTPEQKRRVYGPNFENEKWCDDMRAKLSAMLTEGAVKGVLGVLILALLFFFCIEIPRFIQSNPEVVRTYAKDRFGIEPQN